MKIPDKAKHTNPDGTINGVTYMAELSGLSQAEILWTWNRMKHLVHVEGKTMERAKAILKAEMPSKPWLEAPK